MALARVLGRGDRGAGGCGGVVRWMEDRGVLEVVLWMEDRGVLEVVLWMVDCRVAGVRVYYAEERYLDRDVGMRWR